MHFDIISFLIGFGVATVIGVVLFRFRSQITAVQQTAESQAGTTRKFITNSTEGRYYHDLARSLDAYHIAGDLVKLRDIYVEPRFLRAIEMVDPDPEKAHNIFGVIPAVHDFPYSYAPYNVETLTIHDLRAGETHLALLGTPGSGKSTALAIMGLLAANEIELSTMDMTTDAILEDEIKNLSPDDKAKVIKQRQEIQQRAVEHLQQTQAKDQEEGKLRAVVEFERLLPILVHLRDIDLRPEAFGLQPPAGEKAKNAKGPTKTLDPAEPVVRALQHRASAITASTLPRMIYNRLTAGTCLVLIDGYEDLADVQRAEKLVWLKQFVDVYKANFIVVTGPAVGFDPLLNIGLAPIFLRAWSDADFEGMVQRWALQWPTIAGTVRKPAPMPEERVVRRVVTSNRGRVPLDITLKTWAAFAGDEQDVGRRGSYDFYLRQRLDQKDLRTLLERIAAESLNQGGQPVTRDKVKELAATAGPDGKPIANADEAIGKLLGRAGLFIDWPGNAYGIVHPLITGFLASETLSTADQVAAVLGKPAWDLALPFAAAKVPFDAAVTQRLSSAPDLLYSSLFGVVSWLPEAPPNAPWRAEIFKRLTAALLAPSQYPTIRERAMAALVASRDKNILFIFKQALRSTDPDVRRLGAVGLGALGETDAIKDLGPVLTDSDPNVQLAAGMALGAIGSEAALETMLGGFVEGEQALRQAVAEALAAVPGEGHAVLRDAMTSQDMMVRRAAVFGLARIKSAWALSLLYRAMLEDEQWYVRNAAEQAFREAEGLEATGATRHPEADSLPWLVTWAAQKGEGVPAGPNARQVLIRVLQEGDPLARSTAALTLANLGHVPALKPLYGALRDRDDKVRAAVYQALGNLQTRLGEELPAVV